MPKKYKISAEQIEEIKEIRKTIKDKKPIKDYTLFNCTEKV